MRDTPYTLRLVDGIWIAHAVAFDLVGTDADKDKAVQQLRICLIAQIGFAVKRGSGVRQCFFPAPLNYWTPPYEFMDMPTDAEIGECKFTLLGMQWS